MRSTVDINNKNEFFNLLMNGTPADLESALDAQPNFNLSAVINDQWQTPLHICAIHRIGLIPILLAHGADPNKVDKNKQSPLYYLLGHFPENRKWNMSDQETEILIHQHIQTGILLLQNKADPNVRGRQDRTLLSFTAGAAIDSEAKYCYLETLLGMRTDPSLMRYIPTRAGRFSYNALDDFLDELRRSERKNASDLKILLLFYFYGTDLIAHKFAHGLSALQLFLTSSPEIRTSYGAVALKKSQDLRPLFHYQAALMITDPLNHLHYLRINLDLALTFIQRIGRIDHSSFSPKAQEQFTASYHLIANLPVLSVFQQTDKLLLAAIFFYYPQMLSYLQKQNIPLIQLGNAAYVYENINIADFRLALEYQMMLEQKKNLFLYFVIILMNDRNNPESQSRLKNIPSDLLLSILLNTYSFSHMDKSKHEAQALMRAVQEQTQQITDLIRLPGGISVIQKEAYNDTDTSYNYQFTFFKSAKSMCRTFDRLPPTPAAKESFRDKYAMSIWQQHSALLKAPDKLVLQEKIEATKLYEPLKSQLKL